MAIDEKALGDLVPQDSAVDRLKRRNRRIRPWESSLVDSPPESSQVDLPSGQKAQGVNQPEGNKAPLVVLPSGGDTEWVTCPGGEVPDPLLKTEEQPVGITPPGLCTDGVSNPEDARPNGYTGESDAAPLVNSPTVFPNQGAPDPEDSFLTSIAGTTQSPTGQITQSVFQPPKRRASSKVDPHRSKPSTSYPGGTPPTGQNEERPGSVDEDGGFDPRPFVPARSSGFEWREKGFGELRIPHRLCEYLNRVTTTRNELLVLSCLVRFSLGFHRPWCEAGYSFIMAWTGISDISNVRKSIRSLSDQGIIRKTREHDSIANVGTIYEVPVVLAYLNYLKASRTAQTTPELNSQTPVGETPSGSVAPRMKNGDASGQLTHGPGGETTTKKENLNQNSKKTLFSIGSPILSAYVEQTLAPQKRESELFFLRSLLQNYKTEEVEKALQYVLKNGTLSKREPCHSPMKYLATAMDQVNSLVRHMELKATEALKVQNAYQVESSVRPNYEHLIREFEATLSAEEQRDYETRIAEESTHNGFKPPAHVIRACAAARWKEETG
jgi:hypothetical protein